LAVQVLKQSQAAGKKHRHNADLYLVHDVGREQLLRDIRPRLQL
jgi:hypothetical protein